MATWSNIEKTARRLGVTVSTCYEWIKKGRLHPIKPKETLLFSVEEIDRLLAEEGERRGLLIGPKDDGRTRVSREFLAGSRG